MVFKKNRIQTKRKVRPNSRLREFAHYIMGGMNIGREIYSLSGNMSSENYYGIPLLFGRILYAMKDANKITLYLFDRKREELEHYVTVEKNENNSFHSIKTNFSQGTINLSSEDGLGKIIRKLGMHNGEYASYKKQKIRRRRFTLDLNNFEIRYNIEPIGENQDKTEVMIIPIKSSDADTVLGHLIVEGKNLKLRGKIMRASVITYISIASRIIYSIVSRHLDDLTRLMNRAIIYNAILKNSKKFLRANDDDDERRGLNFSVFMSDIDNFKRFNDEKGHLEGDKVLKKVASICMSNIRLRKSKTDLVGRYGGEEFLFVIKGQETIASSVASRIRRSIENGTNGEENITCSFGVVDARTTYKIYKKWKEEKIDTNELISEIMKSDDTFINSSNAEQFSKLMIYLSDKAMYKSKDNGRNCVHGFEYSDETQWYNVYRN